MTRLFERFQTIWLNDWAEKFSNKDDLYLYALEYSEILKDLNFEQMKQGLDHCRKTMKWTPSPAEFYQACTNGCDYNEHASAAYKKTEYLQLEHKRDKKKAKLHLENIKNILKN